MNDLYDQLRESHQRQRHLLLQLVRSSARRPQRRRELLRELHIELAAHAAAEERYLYAPILMDDRGLDASRHALSEHHEIDEKVETLQSLEPDGAAWLIHAKALSHQVRHHLKEEERRFFQVSGKILGDAQKRRLATRYQRDYTRMREQVAAG